MVIRAPASGYPQGWKRTKSRYNEQIRRVLGLCTDLWITWISSLKSFPHDSQGINFPDGDIQSMWMNLAKRGGDWHDREDSKIIPAFRRTC